MNFSIDDAIKQLKQPWSPIDLATFNGQVLRIALFEGEYHEHTHDLDEFFIVHHGAIKIVTEKGSVALSQGEGAVIPKGVRHKPIAERPAYVLMIDLVDSA